MSRCAGALFSGLRRFRSDRRGVAALEFALIVPLLLMLYLVTMEIAQAIDTNRRVGRLGHLVADLVTQQQEMDKIDLEGILKIGEATLQPYNRSSPSITITAIQLTDDPTPTAKVVWSRKLVGGLFSAGLPKDNATTIPDELRIPGSFLIRAESGLEYKPVITWAAESKPVLGLASAFDNISMKEVYYLRPRMSTAIPCNDCYK